MTINTGSSLATFINDNSKRFSASVLDFDQRAWVIIRDNKSGHTQDYIEPILDVADYLMRAERRSRRLDTEFQNLLLAWLAEQEQPSDSATGSSSFFREIANPFRL
jgi:hypothetical protein